MALIVTAAKPKENAESATHAKDTPRIRGENYASVALARLLVGYKLATSHTTISNTPHKHVFYTHSVLDVGPRVVYGTETATATGQPDMPNVHGASAAVYSFSVWVSSPFRRSSDAQHCPKKEFP